MPANCGRSITAEVDKYYFQTIICVEKLSLASDVSYMVISVQSQKIINGKDSDETSHVVSLPSNFIKTH